MIPFPSKIGFTALAVATLIALPLVASARPGGGHGMEQAIEQLGLDEQTRTSVFEILDSSRTEGRNLRQKVREAEDQMRSLLEADTPDEAAVMAAADEVGLLKTAANKQRLRTMLAVSALLTPEQRAQLREQHEQKRARRGERGERRKGPRRSF